MGDIPARASCATRLAGPYRSAEAPVNSASQADGFAVGSCILSGQRAV